MTGPGTEVTAECLCIGDELLIGQTLNTNAAWMGQKLGLAGIRPILTRVVGDDKEVIPVSYTHLRAHETVLDLVCRLLLEKKTPADIRPRIS